MSSPEPLRSTRQVGCSPPVARGAPEAVESGGAKEEAEEGPRRRLTEAPVSTRNLFYSIVYLQRKPGFYNQEPNARRNILNKN